MFYTIIEVSYMNELLYLKQYSLNWSISIYVNFTFKKGLLKNNSVRVGSGLRKNDSYIANN